MVSTSTAATLQVVFGTIGTVLWMVQLIPQVHLNYKRKTTAGVSPWLYVSWLLSSVTLGPYAIVQNLSIPIITQPQAYGSLCAVIACQALHYDRGWSKKMALGAFGAYALVGGGIEVALFFALRAAENRGIQGATIFIGSLSDFFLSVGFIPQLILIFRDRRVEGLSYIFLAMDSMGAVFSILSLGFKTGPIDVVALIGYVGIIVLEVAVLVLAAVFNPAAKRRQQAQKELDAQEKGELSSGETETIAPTDENEAHVEEEGKKVESAASLSRGHDDSC